MPGVRWLKKLRNGKLPSVERSVLRINNYKLQSLPDEASYWGLQGGNGIKMSLKTDAGRIVFDLAMMGIPELGRILS